MQESTIKTYRILIPGIFDLLNIGHYKYILQAKQLFKNTEVIIGLMDPKEEESFIGLTAMTYTERFDLVKHVKNVDEVIGECPWDLNEEFLKKNNIDFVVDNQFFPEFKFYEEIFAETMKLGKLKKMKKMEVPKSCEYIRRVLFDLDLYSIRSIERGYKLEQLGIGVWKYKYLQIRTFFKKIYVNCMKRKKQ